MSMTLWQEKLFLCFKIFEQRLCPQIFTTRRLYSHVSNNRGVTLSFFEKNTLICTLLLPPHFSIFARRAKFFGDFSTFLQEKVPKMANFSPFSAFFAYPLTLLLPPTLGIFLETPTPLLLRPLLLGT